MCRSIHWRRSVKKLYLNFSQTSQENTFVGIFFSKSCLSSACKFFKKSLKNTYFEKYLLLTSTSSRQEAFCKKGVPRNFTKFTGKHLCQSLRPATLLKMKLWNRYFPVNFAKFLRTLFSIEHLSWLLLGGVL